MSHVVRGVCGGGCAGWNGQGGDLTTSYCILKCHQKPRHEALKVSSPPGWPSISKGCRFRSRSSVQRQALDFQHPQPLAGTDVPGEAPGVVRVPGWPETGLPFSAGAKVHRIAFISGNQGQKSPKNAEYPLKWQGRAAAKHEIPNVEVYVSDLK